MEEHDPEETEPVAKVTPSSSALAEARQREYARSRRNWAETVGRPYERKSDPRPPPGELDAIDDE